ncbi:FtsQ-type POTRA domain-containing protein [Microbacterium sp. NPDC077184]|uniref:FtsQ-type POTRA domain-containing protein n=1 Tax=Microbacterium sp. NPDC077184 TaxID=3154764 RepID=UPI0034122B2A
MRRPTPLPPPVDDGGVRRDRPEDSPTAESGALEGAGTPTEESILATVIPLEAAPSSLPSAPPPTSSEDVRVQAPGPVRMRDVWRAARARRKALRAEVRRFTVRQRRRRAVWLGACGAVLLLGLATLGVAYSPLFAVEQVRVIGAEQLDVARVEAALGDQIGTPLPLVDADAVHEVLAEFPLIETYAIEARPPHELVVRVVERTPIGVFESSSGFTLVDAAGVVLSTTAESGPGTPILRIDGGAQGDAFDAAGRVVRSLPADIAAQVTEVEASTADDVTLVLGATDTRVVWGSAEDSGLKAVVLEAAMTARPPADVRVYDVSSPSSVVFS